MKKKTIVNSAAYEKAVRTARQYVNVKYDEKIRWKLVDICLSVCDVSQGGRKQPSIYTMRKFAKDIGINYRTLNNWKRVKLGVVDRLPADLLKRSKYNYADLEETLNVIGPESTVTASDVKKAFLEQLAIPTEQKKFVRYIEHLSPLIYNLSRPVLAGNIDKVYLDEMKKMATEIILLIDAEMKLRKKLSLDDRVDNHKQKRKVALENVAEL